VNNPETLALLAHELRSPVAALDAIADALASRREELGPADADRLLRLALEAARDIERIVLDATPDSLRPESVSPAQLVDDVVEAARLRGALVRLEPRPELPTLQADPVRLRQALSNLVGNAVAHSPKGAEVVVAARDVGGNVRITVTDCGEGIAAADQERIFHPGVRLSDRPGRGLGLAVAQAVAAAHGGRVEVLSAPGEGATFTLVLPAGFVVPA
jgi:signal transduction histidine kinase